MNLLLLKNIAAASTLSFLIGVTGCSDGPAEEAGETIDEAIEDVSESIDDACDKATDSNC